MTQPASFSGFGPESIGVGIDELARQAKRFGLLQVYRPGTVFSADSVTRTLVTLDGDLEAIPANSLIGQLFPGTRVMVMTVPPQGVYIIGAYGASLAPTIDRFTTNRTWTKPTGVRYIRVQCQAGGGFGGSSAAAAAGQNSKGSGGGGGEYAESYIFGDDIPDSAPIVVGAGGTSGTPTGGTSSFDGTTVVAIGGGAGLTAASSLAAGFGQVGGLGGTGGTGDLLISGNTGGMAQGSANLGIGGPGGGAHLGGGARGQATGSATQSLAGNAAGLYGGGGGGALSTTGGAAASGGNGGAGVVIVTSYYV